MKASHDKSSAIQIERLSKSFGGPFVLHNFDLEVGWGELFVLLGGNGSGKTTLIKLLATLSQPDSGVIRIAGWDSRRHGSMVRQSIGVVGHEPFLYDALTGYENLQFYGRMYQVSDLHQRILFLANQLEINSVLAARVKTLSHGMQKRLSLARAMLHDPSVLVLDEPETGLDHKALEILDALLYQLRYASKTVFMTTHNLDRALRLASHLAILTHGHITFHESLDTLDTTIFRSRFANYLVEEP